MSVTNAEAEVVLRRWLRSQGYEVSKPRALGETGVDLIARRGKHKLYIEVIGYSSKPPKRARDFFEAFFRAISRLKDGAGSCIIAMPHEYSRGLKRRAAQYGVAWRRIDLAFPELSIWLIDCGPRVCSVTGRRYSTRLRMRRKSLRF